MVNCGSDSVLMVPDGPPGDWGGARGGRTSAARQARASAGTRLGRTARVAIPVRALRRGAIPPLRHGWQDGSAATSGQASGCAQGFPDVARLRPGREASRPTTVPPGECSALPLTVPYGGPRRDCR